MCISLQTILLPIVIACSASFLPTILAGVYLSPRFLSHPNESIVVGQWNYLGNIVQPWHPEKRSSLQILPLINKKLVMPYVAAPDKQTNRVISTNLLLDYKLNRGRSLQHIHPYHLVKRSLFKKKKAKKAWQFLPNPIEDGPLCCDFIHYKWKSSPKWKPKKPKKLLKVVDGPVIQKKIPLKGVKIGGVLPLSALTVGGGPLSLKKGPAKKVPTVLKTGSKLSPAILSPKLATTPLKKAPKAAATLLPLGGKGAKVAKSVPAVLLASQSQGNDNQRRRNGRSGYESGVGPKNNLSHFGGRDKQRAEEEITTPAPTVEDKEAALEAEAALEEAKNAINEAQAAMQEALAAMRGVN